jgi:hypothetical protein
MGRKVRDERLQRSKQLPERPRPAQRSRARQRLRRSLFVPAQGCNFRSKLGLSQLAPRRCRENPHLEPPPLLECSASRTFQRQTSSGSRPLGCMQRAAQNCLHEPGGKQSPPLTLPQAAPRRRLQSNCGAVAANTHPSTGRDCLAHCPLQRLASAGAAPLGMRPRTVHCCLELESRTVAPVKRPC